LTHTATPIDLVGGQQYNIRIDAYEDNLQFQMAFRWRTPGQTTDVVVPPANVLVVTAVETDTPSAVGNVTLKNSSWSPAILAAIQTAGLGTGGVTIPLGGTTSVLPWTTGVNQVSIRFDEDVDVTPGNLVVSGINVPSYAVASVAYDIDTFTATWTLAQPIQSDRVTINFAGVKDLVGNSLSGVSTATVRALAGDGDRDGDVDQADFTASRIAQFSAIGGPGYNVFLDTDTNSAINVLDWQNVLVHMGTSVPSPPPAPSAAPGAVVARAVGATHVVSAETSTAALPLRTISANRARLAPQLGASQVDRSLTSETTESARTLRASRTAVSARRTASQVDAAFSSPFDL
jgi:hypothetical protein